VTTIRGALELALQRSAAFDPDSRRLLETAIHGCDRLSRIVHEIVDLSTIEAERPSGVAQRIAAERLIIDALLDVGRAAATKGVRVETSIEQGLPPILGDHDRLVQVLVNLVSDAIAHAPDGSTVAVSAWRDGSRRDSPVSIGVRDERPRGAAEPRLAVTRALIEQQAGHLIDEYGAAAGAMFTMQLPAAPQQRPAAPAVAEPPPVDADAPPAVPRVLVADDDPDLRDVVTEALAAHGFEVLEAADGRAASDLLARERVDLAVLDITMPHQNGYEVIRQLRAGPLQPDLPVVVLTGTVDERDVPSDLAADVVLTKPANLKRLVTEVRSLLAARHGAR
jgi:CheY-like chemotaxis protein